MGTSRSNRKRQANRGFTLIETLISVVVLTVGLVSVAALMSEMMKNTARARYLSSATILATEKLEDLNRFPASDPAVAVPGGGSVGSLAADTTNAGVDYFDEVQVSNTGGGISETVTGQDASGNTVYTTITHLPDGTVNTSTSASMPPLPGGALVFKRRWMIEMNQPVNGVRRVTVLVVLTNPPVTKTLTFQMSTVRP